MVRFAQKIVKNRRFKLSSSFKLNKLFNKKTTIIIPLLALAISFPIFQSTQEPSKALISTPTIDSLSVDNGPVEGGTELEITGTNFFYEKDVEIVQIVAGGYHSLALDTNGDIWAWGRNANGELGNNATSGATTPNTTPAKVNSTVKFSQVSAGGNHSLAVDVNGDVWSWGGNNYGQLGNISNSGTTNPNPTPTKVIISASFIQVSAGSGHSLALDSEGNVWAWGRNTYGQLGNTTNNSTDVPNPTPTKVSSSASFIQISAGGVHSTALDTDGNAWTWGRNLYGELGNTTNSGTSTANPTPTKVSSSMKFTQVSARWYHSVALDTNGDIWAWGSNRYGQLGNTTNNDSASANPTPTKISSSVKFTQIATGDFYSSALDTNGDIWSCGRNDYGQLGNTTNNGAVTPNPNLTKISSSVNFNQIAAGWYHSIAIDANGDVLTWGRNEYGQIGNTTNAGTDTANPTPTIVNLNLGTNPAPAVASVKFGNKETTNFTVDSNNRITVTTPSNTYGTVDVTITTIDGQTVTLAGAFTYNLPTPTITNVDPNIGPTDGGTEVEITGTKFFYEQNIEIVQTSGGGIHSLALDTNGDIWAWGKNDYGQLGVMTNSGSDVANPIPTKINSDVAFSQISAGQYYSLALDENGDIWVWGSNLYGQLTITTNIGTTNPNQTPIKISSSVNFSQVVAGYYHSLALDENGDVWAWGRNQYGELGNTTNNNTENPNPTLTKVSSSVKFSQVSASGVHSVALDTNGGIWAWGRNNYGQLGNTTNSGTLNPNPTPTKVSSSASFSQISASFNHSMALDTNGDIWTWGRNQYGELGKLINSGTSTANPIPTKVALSVKFSQISAMYLHSMALDSNGDIWAWGWNYDGQLGNLTNNSTSNPNPTPTKINSTISFSQISAGHWHSSALDTNGNVWTWGSNEFGQLGNTININTTNPNPIPAQVNIDFDPDIIPIISNVKFGNTETTSFEVESNTLITTTTPSHNYGTVDVTLTTIDGQKVSLANGFTYNLPLPTITNIDPDIGPTTGGTTVEITGTDFFFEQGIEILQIAAGDSHTCALVSDGDIYCWGRNNYGQLGNDSVSTGSGVYSSIPVLVSKVAGGLDGLTIKQISAGMNHTCAIASDNNAYCWGYNSNGQLGNNTATDSSIPVPVSKLAGGLAGLAIEQISAGQTHTCAIASDGNAYCWGNGSGGKLGNNTTTTSNVPVAVSKLAGGLSSLVVKQISAGIHHTCAIASDGNAYCWGSGSGGRLGNNTATDSSIPVPVSKLAGGLASLTVQQISARYNHTCAIASDGNAYCWGSSSTGSLGNGTATDSNIPVAVSKLDGGLADLATKQITTGTAHTCVVSSNNKAYCWGRNNYGQLGSTINSGTTTPNSTPILTDFNLLPVITISSIIFGSVSATSFTINSPTSITATTPAHPEGPVDVVLTTLDNQTVTATNGYEYQEPFINLIIDESELNLDITPNLTSNDGVVSSTKHTVSFTSNLPLVELSLNVDEDHSNLINLNNNTITVPITNSTLTSPNTLSSNTWGFGLDNRILEQNNPNSNTTWSKIPNNNESPINIKSTTLTEPADPITPTDTDVYYGAKINLDQLAGYYRTTVLYTAVEAL